MTACAIAGYLIAAMVFVTVAEYWLVALYLTFASIHTAGGLAAMRFVQSRNERYMTILVASLGSAVVLVPYYMVFALTRLNDYEQKTYSPTGPFDYFAYFVPILFGLGWLASASTFMLILRRQRLQFEAGLQELR